MRILVVAPHYAEYALRYALALRRHGETALVVDRDNFAAEVDSGLAIDRAGLDIHIIPFRPRRRYYLRALKILLLWFRLRPDAVHIQETQLLRPVLFMLVMRLSSRILLTVHDPHPHSGADSRMSITHRLALWLGRRLADTIIVHGPYCEAEYRKIGPHAGQRILSVPHGNILVPPPELLRKPEERRFLMFGRMHAYKGLEVAVAACERLAAEGVAYTLHMAGRGPELDRLGSRLAALPGVIVENRFMGAAELIGAIQRCGVVLAPYLDATQSGIVAAAFANGRPVIASRVGGLPDFVRHGENGLLVPPGDAAALSQAMRSCAADSALVARLRGGAVQTSATAFDWNGIAEKVVLHLQQT